MSRGGADSSYPAPMPVSARDVAAALRERHPGLPRVKLHKLMYYCQGHHLASFGEPLFTESLSAWDMGPVVGTLWFTEKEEGPARAGRELGEAELNTIGYVLSRYGALTGRDLQHLTHSEEPWRLADAGRAPHTSVRIESGWIERYFRTAEGEIDEDDVVLDAVAVREWLQDAGSRRDAPARPDDPHEQVARVEELRARIGLRG